MAENEAALGQQIRQMEMKIESTSNAQKTKVLECDRLQSELLKLQSHLKEKSEENDELAKQRQQQTREIQTLTQNVSTLNSQITSKVRITFVISIP